MDKILLVAPSTDPIKTTEGIISYANKISEFADFLHCDIMDAKFVANKTYSYDVVKEINSNTLLPLDVHLMVENPTSVIDKYINAGANIVTVHYEAYSNKKQMIKDLKRIRKMGALSGLSLKPATDVNEIFPYLSYCDLVLVMSVEPGKSGQMFLASAYRKVEALNEIRKTYNSNFKIEVDGGVKPEIASNLKMLGADIVVSGNYVYKSLSLIDAINSLK